MDFVLSVTARGFASRPEPPIAATDNFRVQIEFAADGLASPHGVDARRAPQLEIEGVL